MVQPAQLPELQQVNVAAPLKAYYAGRQQQRRDELADKQMNLADMNMNMQGMKLQEYQNQAPMRALQQKLQVVAADQKMQEVGKSMLMNIDTESPDFDKQVIDSIKAYEQALVQRYQFSPDEASQVGQSIIRSGAGSKAAITNLKIQNGLMEKPTHKVVDGQLVTIQDGQASAAPIKGLGKSEDSVVPLSDLGKQKFNLQEDLKNGFITPADVQHASETTENQDDFDNVLKVNKEYRKDSSDFIKIRDSYGRIEASATSPSAAGDLAMIFNYMKMLDPGSVVRESEYATAQNAAGVPDRIRALHNRILDGEKLAVDQRQDFVDRANKLFDKTVEQHNKRTSEYRSWSEKNGLDPDKVLMDLMPPQQNEEPPPPQPTQPQPAQTGTAEAYLQSIGVN